MSHSVKQSCYFSPSGFASGWFPAEEHRSDEGHAESREDPRNPGHHEGAIQRDDEGDWGHSCIPFLGVTPSGWWGLGPGVGRNG